MSEAVNLAVENSKLKAEVSRLKSENEEIKAQLVIKNSVIQRLQLEKVHKDDPPKSGRTAMSS